MHRMGRYGKERELSSLGFLLGRPWEAQGRRKRRKASHAMGPCQGEKKRARA